MHQFTNTFLAEKQQLANCSTIRTILPELRDFEVLFKIEKVGFSSNNITYMALGTPYQYFDFFSATEEPTSTVPVWGVAIVVKSKHGEVRFGERVYGYFPLSQYCILRPDIVKKAYFTVQRPQLPADRAVYHQYFRASGDVEFEADKEEYMCIFRPLWGTSFFLDDFLQENSYFGGDVVVVSSASSKTAYCYALLQQGKRTKVKVIGLTSSGNVPFVKSLGWYDQVVDYRDLDEFARSINETVTYVDIAGNQPLNSRIHKIFGDRLQKQVTVGMSHFNNGDLPTYDSTHIKAEKMILFFAPEWIEKRAPKEGEDLVKRRSKAWKDLLDNAHKCVDLKVLAGSEAVKTVYLNMLAGKANPRDGFILSLFSSRNESKL